MLSEFEPVTSLSVLAKSLGVTSAQLHFLLEEHFAGHSSLLWHSAPMHRARVSLSGCVIFQSCCSAWFQNVLAMKKAFKIVFYVQEQKGVCQPRGQAGPGHYGETGQSVGS